MRTVADAMSVVLVTGCALLTLGSVLVLFADSLGRDALVGQRTWLALLILAGIGAVGALAAAAA
jgi:hypothetical protein